MVQVSADDAGHQTRLEIEQRDVGNKSDETFCQFSSSGLIAHAGLARRATATGLLLLVVIRIRHHLLVVEDLQCQLLGRVFDQHQLARGLIGRAYVHHGAVQELLNHRVAG
jgi:hypothetical protein